MAASALDPSSAFPPPGLAAPFPSGAFGSAGIGSAGVGSAALGSLGGGSGFILFHSLSVLSSFLKKRSASLSVAPMAHAAVK